MRTNCVNCGAAIDIDEQKCPFCGTSYFDLTDIDFTASDPVAVRMKSSVHEWREGYDYHACHS